MSPPTITVRASEAPPPPGGRERRTAPRFPSNLETTCSPLSNRGAGPWPARILDISRGGVALVVGRRFEAGTVLTMTLENADEAVSRSLLARVVHVRTEERGLWVHGCRFSSELYDEDLKAFCAERVQPQDSDHRSWARFTCDVPTSCRPAEGGDAMPVRVVNISAGGVGLLAPSDVMVGTRLLLKLPPAAGQPGRRVLIRVVQVTRMSESVCLLGCEFANELKDQELRGLTR